MRSDTQIQRDVIADVNARQRGPATCVAVEVHGGIVTLTGRVGAEAARDAIEQAAQGVEGVQALVVDIDVQRPGSVSRSDADIALAVRGILQWQAYLPLTTVGVTVARGWVTLAGEVETNYPRLRIDAAVRQLVGVRGIHDEVVLRVPVTPAAVRAGVLAALGRRAEIDLRDVTVDVRGAEVTLTGSVDNWWQRELARRSAWGAPGVRQVIDRLEICSPFLA